MTYKQWIVGQFHHPRGVAGRFVGWFMATRGSNRARTRWVVSLLDVQPGERVLEVGFGPGVGISLLARVAGQVYGIDHSAVMVRQASRRNAAAVRAGRVSLTHASVDRLPSIGPVDAVMAVNTTGMWPAPVDRLVELRGLLRPGGRIALASQPRCPGATAETTAAAGRELAELLSGAGFAEVRTEILDLDPPAACVLATTTP